MNYLLDTHTLLWALLEPKKLLAAQHKILHDRTAQKFFSTITMWEISLKFSLGKLELGGYQPEGFFQEATQIGLRVLPPTPNDFSSFHRLPAVEGHKDPFDRMLTWQAIQNNLTLLTQDRQLPQYNIHGLTVV